MGSAPWSRRSVKWLDGDSQRLVRDAAGIAHARTSRSAAAPSRTRCCGRAARSAPRPGRTPRAFDLGGVSGGDVMLLPGVTLGAARFFPVRGFIRRRRERHADRGRERGAAAAARRAASRLRLLPALPRPVERDAVRRRRQRVGCRPTAGDAASNAIASVGAELTVFVGVPYDVAPTRCGSASPLRCSTAAALQVPAATFYVTLGGGN